MINPSIQFRHKKEKDEKEQQQFQNVNQLRSTPPSATIKPIQKEADKQSNFTAKQTLKSTTSKTGFTKETTPPSNSNKPSSPQQATPTKPEKKSGLKLTLPNEENKARFMKTATGTEESNQSQTATGIEAPLPKESIQSQAAAPAKFEQAASLTLQSSKQASEATENPKSSAIEQLSTSTGRISSSPLGNLPPLGGLRSSSGLPESEKSGGKKVLAPLKKIPSVDKAPESKLVSTKVKGEL